ncbi:MAG: thioredoxin-disulfide reductase [Candidatus Methylarchaceae archaeon HK02M2]|nr:thioredoxin-disulfide reductase [Candidatus Methylarchaceae archaeon HK02M2]
MINLVIIGSGPAGLTAAIYAGRHYLKPLVIAGQQPGGQLMLTTKIENYPGFPEGIQGPELMNRIRKQAERFGAEFIDDDVTSVNFTSHPFEVEVNGKVYKAKSVIIATGSSAKWLGLDSEQRLKGRGVSTCAVCDGFFFKNKDVVVIGGGNRAIYEALDLTKFVKKVDVIYWQNRLRANKTLQNKAYNNKKINFKLNSVVEDILGKNVVEGIVIRDIETLERTKLDCQGVFIAIGYKPNTDIFKGQIELDNNGYIITKNYSETSIKGVFAAGNVCNPNMQAIIAAGMGCQAAINVNKYIESLE